MATSVRDHPDVRSNVDLLSAWIEGQLAYRGWPGLSIAVAHERDVVWSRGFGWADLAGKVEATAETLYRVASITKTFTATAILQLRDAGKLRLDDEVRHHLPWFTPPTLYTDAPPITLRHILTHTTGLAREAPFPYWTDLEFPAIDAIRAARDAHADRHAHVSPRKQGRVLEPRRAGRVRDRRRRQGRAGHDRPERVASGRGVVSRPADHPRRGRASRAPSRAVD